MHNERDGETTGNKRGNCDLSIAADRTTSQIGRGEVDLVGRVECYDGRAVVVEDGAGESREALAEDGSREDIRATCRRHNTRDLAPGDRNVLVGACLQVLELHRDSARLALDGGGGRDAGGEESEDNGNGVLHFEAF
jgi:hypothetical protein